jgi:SAM-dependent methyltransferase
MTTVGRVNFILTFLKFNAIRSKRFKTLTDVFIVLSGFLSGFTANQGPQWDRNMSYANNNPTLARSVFAPAYRDIARQIITATRVTQGVCLDIGCGAGYLGAAIASVSDLLVLFFDRSPDMLSIARRTINTRGLQTRAATLQGEVSAIALPDACIDLAVCRSAGYFWDGMAPAFQEIHRVLAPDGLACIGGGMGLPLSIRENTRKMCCGRPWEIDARANTDTDLSRLDSAFRSAGIESISILRSDAIGLWLVMQKAFTDV